MGLRIGPACGAGLSAGMRRDRVSSQIRKKEKKDSWPIQPDIHNPPLLQLASRKPLWLDLQQLTSKVNGGIFATVDIKSQWRHNWKSPRVFNSHLVCDCTIWQPGFDLPRQQWSLLNRFCMEKGHCGACRRKWRLTLILCVLVARSRRCPTLSNLVP